MPTRYDPSVKVQALRLVATGMSVREVAESMEIPGPTIWKWVYRARAAGELPLPTRDTVSLADDLTVPIEVAVRIRDLETRLATLEENQAFLGKVSAFFAKQHQREMDSTRW